jgi:hypothetical protein
MSNYFNNFPTTYYTNNNLNNNHLDVVTDITKRIAFEESFKDNSSLYLDFLISDEDTPEVVAHKYYGDVEKHWAILMMNNIIDPQFDWPLRQRDLPNYIKSKYASKAAANQTGLEWAQANIKSYYRIETKTVVSTGQETITKTEIDSNTYTNLIESTHTYQLQDGKNLSFIITKEVEYYYDYEINLNEEKRKIKILRKEYIPLLNTELQNIFNAGR